MTAFQRNLLIAAMVAFGVLLWGDLLLWHPGFSELDESATVRYGWEMFHGGSAPPSITTGYLYRVMVGLSQLALGPHEWALHLAGIGMFFLECWLLWRFCRRHFGPNAAWGALMAALLSAFNLGRTRGLLSMSIIPAELLLVIELAELGPPQASLIAGFLGGVFALEYEAWIYSAWTLLFVMALLSPPKSKPPWLAGFAAGATLALALSWPNLKSYAALRSSFTLKASGPVVKKIWAESLLGLVWGGDAYPGLGSARGHPSLAPWAMPFIALGAALAWKRKKILLLWCGCGLILLIPPSAGLNESHRAIVAWPALAILAGLGLEWAWQGGRLRALLALWILGGAFFEGRAFLRSQESNSSKYYGNSRARFAAAAWLKENGGGKLLGNLGDKPAGDFAWMDSGRKISGDGVVAILRWEQLPIFGTAPKGLHAFRDPKGVEEVYLFMPPPALAAKLENVDKNLGAFWRSLPLYDHLAIVSATASELANPRTIDRWQRTSLWQRRMVEAAPLGRVDEALMAELRREPLLHAGPLYHPSFVVGRFNAELGAELHAQALRVDPRLKEFELKNQSLRNE